MTIFLFILFAVAVFSGLIKAGSLAIENRSDKKTYGLGSKDIRTLSDAGRKIMVEFNTIPAANRPHGNMFAVLTALDKKFGGKEKVNEHFQESYFIRDGYRSHQNHKFSWEDHDSCKYDRFCDMQEYRDIIAGLQAINEALGEQAYALEMAGISGQLEQAQSMIEQMKEEKKIITTITKELT